MSKSKKKSCPQIKEAALLAGSGIIYQQKGNGEMAKTKIQEGIEKLKQGLVNDSSIDREMVLNYYSGFEKFQTNITNQTENENKSEIIQNIIRENTLMTPSNKETFNSILNYYNDISKSKGNDDAGFDVTQKCGVFISNCRDYGICISKSVFIRGEVFTQSNAKIEYLHQKYQTYKFIQEQFDNLNIYVRQSAGTYENVEKFCFTINDGQMNLSQNMPFVKRSKHITSPEVAKGSLGKTFSGVLNKGQTNMQSNKGEALPDYFEILCNVCAKFKDLSTIFDIKSYKNPVMSVEGQKKKKEICEFFFNTIIKWNITDIKDGTSRFLKKKLLPFESA